MSCPCPFFLLAIALSWAPAHAATPEITPRRSAGVLEAGVMMRVDGAPPLPPSYGGDPKDGSLMVHGAFGALAPIGSRSWLGPVIFGSVGEVGGFMGVEARWRRPLAGSGNTTCDLSAGLLLSGEIEDVPTRLPGLTLGAGLNLSRFAALTARVDIYRYWSGDDTPELPHTGTWRAGSDFFLGVQAMSWGALLVAAGVIALAGASMGSSDI